MGEVVIVKTVHAWTEQMKAAYARLLAHGMTAGQTLHDALAVDREAVADLVQALHALGHPVDPKLIRECGLAPVAQVLEIPE